MKPAATILREAAKALGPEHGRLSCDLLHTAGELDRAADILRDSAIACEPYFAKSVEERARLLGTLISHAKLAADAASAPREAVCA